MVEMQETANIINNATPNSLVIMDEIGRGTSTYDGLAIAHACVEHLVTQTKCLVLFATHYFELTHLASKYSQIQNLHVAIKEFNQQIIFLHQIKEGRAKKSYGIHVAKLAGLPPNLIMNANSILTNLEDTQSGSAEPIKSSPRYTDEIINQIKNCDLNSINPKEAWTFIEAIQKLIDEQTTKS